MNLKSVTSRSLGKLLSLTKSGNEVTGATDHGHFKVTCYSPSVIRLSISSDQQFENFSYSVVAQPNSSSINLAETELDISTSEVKLVISRNPVRFKFTDLSGNVINQDEEGLGTSWIGDQVTTYKKLQEG